MVRDEMTSSVSLPARAMHQMFTKAVEADVQPVEKFDKNMNGTIDGLRDDIGGPCENVDTTNGNTGAMFAQQRKNVAADVKSASKSRR